MLFETRFQDQQLPSVRGASCLLHHYETYQEHQEETYSFFPAHCHTFFELQYYFCSENAQENPCRHFHPGTLRMFNPLQPHSPEDIGFEYMLQLQISPTFLKNSLSCLSPERTLRAVKLLFDRRGYQVPKGSLMETILLDIAAIAPVCEENQNLAELREQSRKKYSPQFEAHLYGACLRLLGELMQMNLVEESSGERLTLSDEMIRLVEKIVTNPGQRISMKDAAAAMHMSYSDFSRNFKKMIGIGYVDFINNIRVNEAQNLLRQTNLSSGSIAELLGFGSASYFNRIFQEFAQCTPSEFRRHY